jgi:hypothetical protein
MDKNVHGKTKTDSRILLQNGPETNNSTQNLIQTFLLDLTEEIQGRRL